MADPASQDVSASLVLLTGNAATESELMLPSSSAPASAMERAKIKNRTAQKRFRDRQKASMLFVDANQHGIMSVVGRCAGSVGNS